MSSQKKYSLYLSFIALLLLGSRSITTPSSSNPLNIRFAVIGDYGLAGQPEQNVATLVKSWVPDFIITLGDNNYYTGSATTIDVNIGQYYHDYIFPYQGSYGTGASENKFFPILGNHDWDTSNAQPYLDYFSLPGNERYYDFVQGPIQFFILDSDPREPDGTSNISTQALWLKDALAASVTPWQIVLLHHAPYSSSSVHGSNSYMQWDFKNWGADAVLAGHDHTYERIIINGLPYFVNGLGGSTQYTFNATPVVGSEVRYHDDFGAMLISATNTRINFQFWSRAQTKVDEYILQTTFADVPKNYWAWPFIESISNAGITAGCSTSPSLIYCPEQEITRAQMAVFLLKSMHDVSFVPPTVGNATGFGDVTVNYWASAWIKQLAAESITSGCGNGNYCPDLIVTRAQMAIFLLKAKYGSLYIPPATGSSTGFSDVAVNYWAAPFIKQLVLEGITNGCGAGNYCPDQAVTRAEMAVFLVKTFNLP